jgi:hypothetical protein
VGPIDPVRLALPGRSGIGGARRIRATCGRYDWGIYRIGRLDADSSSEAGDEQQFYRTYPHTVSLSAIIPAISDMGDTKLLPEKQAHAYRFVRHVSQEDAEETGCR